jgi:hypothetical protein
MTMPDLDAVVAVEARAYGWPWSRGNFIDALAAGYVAEVLEDRDAGLMGMMGRGLGADEDRDAWQTVTIGVSLESVGAASLSFPSGTSFAPLM